jgi:hypothetical protein
MEQWPNVKGMRLSCRKQMIDLLKRIVEIA